MSWSRLSFRMKIMISLLLLVFLLSGLALILSNYMGDLSEISAKLVDKSVPELLYIDYWQKEVALKRVLLHRFINERPRPVQFLQEFYDYYELNNFPIPFKEAPSALIPIVVEIERLNFLYHNKIKGLIKYDNVETAEKVILKELFPGLLLVERDLQKAYQHTYDSLMQEKQSINYILNRSLWALLIISSLAIILSIYFSYWISLGLSRPVEQMIEQVDLISQGQYGLQLPPLAQYELQRLTDSINQMSVSLECSFARLSQEKLFREQILTSIPMGIITVNDDTQEIQVNDHVQHLLNVEVKDLERLLSDPTTTTENKSFWQCYHSGQFFETKKMTLTINGLEQEFLVSQSPIRDQQGQIIGRIFHFVDISEMAALERRIYHAEKLALVGELAAGASHEIRNPLTVIHGLLQLMRNDLSPEENKRYHIALLLQELERINKIVEKMMMMAKPDAPLMKQVSLRDILDELLPLIDDGNPSISFRVEIAPLFLYVDKEQIKQVFLNLIRNSIDALDGEGTIYLYTEVDGDQVHIFIADNGSGIPVEIQNQIFEPFMSNKEAGTGLGLTITQQILATHHGEINLVSSDEEGTVFRITLPTKDKIMR